MKSLLFTIVTVCTALAFVACESKWDEHVEVTGTRGKTLMQIVAENPQTSVFASILKSTGYDKLMEGNRLITVFAPVNSALAAVNMNDSVALLAIVKNHISFSNHVVTNGAFAKNAVEMINTKTLPLNGLKIGEVSVVHQQGMFNVTASNGILHIIDKAIPFQMNIWEFLQTQPQSLQVAFIKDQDRLIMDMERSIQIGVDPRSGRPMYDTVWINQNPFLNQYKLNDELANYTFILLPNQVVERIEAKYRPYFAKQNTQLRDSIVRSELVKDCVLLPVEITANGRYLSVDGVLIDIQTSQIVETYRASNGIVYRMNDADVKLFENKIKTILIEAEDFHSVFANNLNAWMLRNRPTLSGGRDMVLNSGTIFTTPFVFSNRDTTITVNITRTFFPISTSNVGNVNNCFIEFRPVINSVAYRVYWSAFNDYVSNSNLAVTMSINTGRTTETVNTTIACRFSQKLLISFPDRPRVTRLPPNGLLQNNFVNNAVFTSSRFVAGVQEEKQLFRSLLSEDAANVGLMLPRRNLAFTNEDNFFEFFNGTDQFGNREMLINPTYGQATIMVANTTENRAANTGMIFLDYIKLVPVVNPNE